MAKMSVIVGSICTVALLAVAVFVLLSPGKSVFYIVGYIAIAFLFAAGCVSVFSGVRYLNSKPPLYSVNLVTRGLEVVEQKRSRTYAWSEFSSFTESDTAFALTLKGTLAQLQVSKSSLAAGQIAHLRTMLMQRPHRP